MSIDVVERRSLPRLSHRSLLVCCVLLYGCAAAMIWPGAYGAVLEASATRLFRLFRLVAPLLLMWFLAAALFASRKNRLDAYLKSLAARLAGVAAAVVLFLVALSAYTTVKIAIPDIVPFYADPFLADLDKWLHGDDPWRLLYATLPAPSAQIINVFYSILWFLQWFGMVVFVACWRDRAAQTQYFWAMFLTFVICGNVLAILGSSFGPIYYDHMLGGDRFAELTARLYADPALHTVTVYADFLLRAYEYGSPQPGTGISSAPSMHVAIVTLNALLLSRLNLWAGVVAWLFWAIIMIGSVYTGWHYAVDGYISLAVVWLIWRWTSRAFLAANSLSATRRQDAPLRSGA